MPNTKAAKKALRVSNRKQIINQIKKNKITQARRKLNKLLTTVGTKKDEFVSALATYFSELDKAGKTQFMHNNTIARLKSRMTMRIKKVLGEDKYETAGVKKEKVAKAKPASKPATKKATVKKTTPSKDSKAAAPAKASAKKAAPKKTSKKAE